MAKLNMANMNTLFRKVYLLAGLVMAANMFAVNEMKAMENNNKKGKTELTSQITSDNPVLNEVNNMEVKMEVKKKEIKEEGTYIHKTQLEPGIMDKILFWENRINFFGGIIVSGFNNYLKWWDYNPGVYRQFGCIGWRSKRSLYEVLQFEVNFNLGRGAIWSISHIINLILKKTSAEKDEKSEKDGNFSWTLFFFEGILRGFTSMPLTFHISNFSISISLDSIIWMGIDKFLKLKFKKELKKNIKEGKIVFENMTEMKDLNNENKFN